MLRPLNKNIVLKKQAEEKKTASGIILTDTSKEKSSIASVVAIGKDCDLSLQVEDRVVYKEYSGTNVNIDDQEYIVIAEKDILAVVE